MLRLNKLFLNSISLAAALVLTIGCSSHYFVIPKEQVKSEIKKILVLPLYANSSLAPDINTKNPEFTYNLQEIKEYSDVFVKRGQFIDRFLNSILKEGQYQFEIVTFQDDLNKNAKRFEKIDLPTLDGKSTNAKSFIYRPKSDYIQELAAKYKVDAIFYQTVYGIFKSSNYFAIDYGRVFIPSVNIHYAPFIFKADGTLIFNPDNLSAFMTWMHKPKKVADRRYTSVKANANDILKSLTKDQLMYTMFADFGDAEYSTKRDKLILGLCDGRFSCEMTYFGTKDE